MQHTQSHAHRHIGVLDHLRELLEADLAVVVQIRLHNGLVHNLAIPKSQQSHPSHIQPNTVSPCPSSTKTHLLQLLILQIAPHHHLQHNKQLAIANVPIAIDIIHFERKPQLLLLVALAAESAEPGHEFLEIDVSAAVFVEDGDHARGERVGGDLGQLQEFFALDCAGSVLGGLNVSFGLVGLGVLSGGEGGALCPVS